VCSFAAQRKASAGPLAEEFARNGHTLLLVARDEAALALTARALAERHGVRVESAAQDLSTADACAGGDDGSRPGTCAILSALFMFRPCSLTIAPGSMG
jgi:hypothetical protein